jgi:hypothetical protein
MSLHIRCGNGHEAYVPDCTPQCAAIDGAHLSGCPGDDLDALLVCPAGSGCCDGTAHPGAGHEAGANACPLIASDPEHNHHALGRDQTVDNPDCGVCRPVTITFYDGGNPASLQLVTG